MTVTSYLLIMLLWLVFDALLALVRLADSRHRTPTAVAGASVLSVLRLSLAVLTLALLGGVANSAGACP